MAQAIIHMDDQAIVNLVTIPEENISNEEEDEGKNAELSNQKNQCRVSHAEAMRMLDECLTCLRFQKEATVSNTSTLVRLRELAAEKRESSWRQSAIYKFFSLHSTMAVEISVSSQRGGTPSRANSCCAAMWHATSKKVRHHCDSISCHNTEREYT